MESISVIIPTWNRASLLQRAIWSVTKQTLPVTEILICDDGSSDNTYELIQSLGRKNSTIRWIPGDRAGRPAIPRNRGIKASSGEWLAFIDSDDLWLPNKLERQLASIKENHLRAVCSNAYRNIPGEGIIGEILNRDAPVITFDDLFLDNSVICSSVVLHRSVLDYVTGFPEDRDLHVVEDFALWLRVATVTNFAYISDPLLVYREEPAASHSGTGTQNIWEQRRLVTENFLDWGVKHSVNPEFLEKAETCHQDALDHLKCTDT